MSWALQTNRQLFDAGQWYGKHFNSKKLLLFRIITINVMEYKWDWEQRIYVSERRGHGEKFIIIASIQHFIQYVLRFSSIKHISFKR